MLAFDTGTGQINLPAEVRYHTEGAQPAKVATDDFKPDYVTNARDEFANVGTGEYKKVESRTSRMTKLASLPVSEPEKTPGLSAAYAEYRLSEELATMQSYLVLLKPNLDTADGARAMTLFRDSIGTTWNLRTSLPKNKVLLLSMVEETIRGKKWREFTGSQVEKLEHILKLVAQKTITEKDFARAVRSIGTSGLDIFPSSLTDGDEAEEQEE